MPRPWLSLVLLRASLLFWTSLVLWPQVMGRTAMGMAAAVGTSPVTLTSGHPDLLGFCTGRPSGVHCHPDRGQWRVWCPPPVTTTGKAPTGSDDTTARLLPCPADHICRAHHKLQSVVVQGEGRGIDDNTTAAVPQCVPTDKTDLDAFCEDKLYGVMAARSDAAAVALDELRQRYVETMMSDAVANASSLIAGDSVLMAVRQCNPFNAQRKQLLDCVVVQRACAVDLNEGVVGAEKGMDDHN